MEMPYKLEVLWCRSFQSVLKIGNYFMGYRMPKYLEGPGKIRELGAFLKEKGINDVLVVTGSGMVRRSLNDTICVQNGYSIVADPKKRSGKSYKWLGDKKKLLW